MTKPSTRKMLQVLAHLERASTLSAMGWGDPTNIEVQAALSELSDWLRDYSPAVYREVVETLASAEVAREAAEDGP